jgi:ubiquinone/menaquinone biosynthesis C-methylase UbiE
MPRKSTPYLLPKDEGEAIRLNMQHRLLREARGGQTYAPPLRHPARVLDVACGTGIWAHELSRLHRFKHTSFLNTDLDTGMAERYTAHLAKYGIAHPNVTFQQMDALQPFPFADATFDYVHGRFLVSFVPVGHWPGVIAEMVRVTKPGGWLELVETSLIEGGGRWYQQLRQAALDMARARMGAIETVSASLLGWMEAVGVEQLAERVLEIGGGEYAALAPQVAEDVLTGLENMRGVYQRAHIFTREELDALLAGIREEVQTTPLVLPVRIVWGRKPRMPR